MAGDRVTFKEAGIMLPPEQDLHLLPLLKPSGSSSKAPLNRLPNVNAASRRNAFTTSDEQGTSLDWFATTHIFPSAYPRSHYAATAPPSQPFPSADISRGKQSRAEEQKWRKDDLEQWSEMAQVYSVESLYPPSSEEEAMKLAENLVESKQPRLWSAIERIVPNRPIKGGITLFLAHANGFHKELYEPMTQVVINSLAKQGKNGVQISEVWSIDTFNSGDSGALNKGLLGQTTSWFDHPRDMLQFLDFYMPEQGDENVPTLLQEHDQATTRKGRIIIGVGHSFSGAGMSMLNTLNPGYFEGVVLVDPVGHPFRHLPNQAVMKDVPMAQSAIARKDVFANRQAVADYLKTKAFFNTWDPQVIDLHIQYGFQPFEGHEKEAENTPVTLSMSKWSEALAFSTSFLGSFATSQVKRSRYNGWAHLICTSGGSAGGIFGPGGEGPEELQDEFVKYFSTSKRASTEIMEGGHLIVQEQPDVLGARIAEIIIRYQSQQTKSKSARL